MFKQTLLPIYLLFLDHGKKVIWIERYLNLTSDLKPSIDDRRNQPSLYTALFSEQGKSKVEELYYNLINKIKMIPYEQSADELEALDFLQAISATALYKYHLDLGDTLDKFVKEFDRLDVPSERFRLYQKIKEEGVN